MRCKRDSDGRSIDNISLQVMRQQAVKAVRNGQTVNSVAAAFGVNIRTVFRWLSDFACGGQKALLAKPIPGRRFGMNVNSAVSARGEFRFMVQEGAVTAMVFREFLKRLMTGAKQPIFLVVDGRPIHKAKLAKDYVEQQQGQLKLVYLPPYSPN